MSKNDVIKIYEEAFGREAEFENELFSLCEKHLRVLKIDGKTLSFFFLLPVIFNIGDIKENGFYLFAAATDKNFRNQGYMGQLIKKVLKETNLPIFLKPANKNLIPFYEKFGFECFNASYNENKNFNITPTLEFSMLNLEADEKNGNYVAMCIGIDKEKIENISFRFTME